MITIAKLITKQQIWIQNFSRLIYVINGFLCYFLELEVQIYAALYKLAVQTGQSREIPVKSYKIGHKRSCKIFP